jgi:hypothetical protein
MATKTELKIGHFLANTRDENSKIVASGGTRKALFFLGDSITEF